MRAAFKGFADMPGHRLGDDSGAAFFSIFSI
jgi:hypothetical protein